MKYFSLLLLILVTGCESVQIQNAHTCTVSGKFENGGLCSRLTSPDKNLLTFNELIDLLTAQAARKCVPVLDFNVCADNQSSGVLKDLPARGAAIIIPSVDFGTIATELAEACRILGKYCSYQTKTVIKGMKAQLK